MCKKCRESAEELYGDLDKLHILKEIAINMHIMNLRLQTIIEKEEEILKHEQENKMKTTK